jgi:UPF0042 nucleotide-binding protein
MAEHILLSQQDKDMLLQLRKWPSISVMSFAFRNGAPLEADIIVDARFLRDPHEDVSLRAKTGLDAAVGAYIEQDDGFEPFFSKLQKQIKSQFIRCAQEGKDLMIAVGCAGGQHRSVFTVDSLRNWLEEQGIQVSVEHREL